MRCSAVALGYSVLTALVFTTGGPCVAEVDPSVACGDVNGDRSIDISDGIHLLSWLYLGGPGPACGEAVSGCGDTNADETVDLSDAVYIFGWLFLGGPAPECPIASTFTFIGDNAQGYPEYTHDQTGIVFVRLPGGTFNMGSPDEEAGHWYDEGPVHEVTLSPFLIAKYEVTQAKWEAVMGINPSAFPGDDRPVEQVSWDDVQQFEAATGLTLPTEAQWEYACRAGTDTAFSFGPGESCNDWSCASCPARDAYMWYCGNRVGYSTQAVGTKAANPFGLHDMHGNVFEWCEDLYDRDFYSTPDAAGPDPLCTAGSENRVARGGSWNADARLCCSANREEGVPGNRFSSLGFRPAAPSP